MHYVGQTHAISGAAAGRPGRQPAASDAEMVREAFETSYQGQFSRNSPAIPVKIVSLRTAAIGRRPHFDLTALAPPPDASSSRPRGEGTRQVWFDGAWLQTAIWSRLDLPSVAIVEGPAILEQPDATTRGRSGPCRAGRCARQPDPRKSREMSPGRRSGLADRRSAERLPASERAPTREADRRRRHRRAAGQAEAARRLVRARGGWIVSTHFTLVPGRGGEPH